jgi:hypothetical protein
MGAFTGLFALGFFVVGFRLWLKIPRADHVAQMFLVVVAQWRVLGPFVEGLAAGTLAESNIVVLVGEAVLGVVYPAIWVAYLTHSVRVKNTFASKSAMAKTLSI